MSRTFKIKLFLIIILVVIFAMIYLSANTEKEETVSVSSNGIFYTDVSGNTYGYVDTADVYAPEYSSNVENVKKQGECKITDGYLFLNDNWVECDNTIKTFLNSGFDYITVDKLTFESQLVTLSDNSNTIDIYLSGEIGSSVENAYLTTVVANSVGSTFVKGFCVGDSITKASKVLGDCYLDTTYSVDGKGKTWVNSDSSVVFTCYYNSYNNVITSMSVEYINR